MQRPKGDSPNGRLETIPSRPGRRQAVLDHATLRRYLVDAGLLRRERGVYRRT